MIIKTLITGILLSVLTAHAATAIHLSDQDKIILEMKQSYVKKQGKKLAELLPKAKGHKLEAWAAYWELTLRLSSTSDKEIMAFLKKYDGTYQADRLRNDWLLFLGKNKRWHRLLQQREYFIMNDDSQVDCYTLMGEYIVNGKKIVTEINNLWQTRSTDACEQAAIYFIDKHQISSDQVWPMIGKLLSSNFVTRSKILLQKISPQHVVDFNALLKNPDTFLTKLQTSKQLNNTQQKLAILALMRLNRDDPLKSAKQLDSWLNKKLNQQDLSTAWAAIAQIMAMRQNADALKYYAKSDINFMSQTQLEWQSKAALRALNWAEVTRSIKAMDQEQQQLPIWKYWQTQAILKTSTNENDLNLANQTLSDLSEGYDFYGLLAREQLQKPFKLPPSLYNITEKDIQWVNQQEGLKRSIYAYKLGLNSESFREWNFATVFIHRPNKLSDTRLMAAAQLACNSQVWYLCINTSERTQQYFNWQQRYPTPFKDIIQTASKKLKLDTGLVYGLIRQESRFVYNIKSSVGAAGLMQVMPKTASWTAKKIGLENYKPHLITDPKTNVTIGTSYLRKVLDRFEDSLPMATAAYNAGPNRPERWRKMPKDIKSLEGALWVENIPFSETRNYVKVVLTNAVIYQHILENKGNTILTKLGTIHPTSNVPVDGYLP